MTLSFALKMLALLALACIVFGCSRKKKTPENLAQWLEAHYPGRYEVVETSIADPIRNMSFKAKKSIVCVKGDSLLQIQIAWDKRDANLGLSGFNPDSSFAQAKNELDKSRQLLQWVKAATDKKISVSVRYGVAYIFVFEEPSPENRKLVAAQLAAPVSQWLETTYQQGLAIHFMAPEVYRTEFEDIVPLKVWIRPDIWLKRKMIISLFVEETKDFSTKKAEKLWQLNLHADKILQWTEKAYPIAQNWARSHIKQAHNLSQNARFSLLKNQLGILIEFPVQYANAPEEEEEPDYVSCVYSMDDGQFGQLKIE